MWIRPAELSDDPAIINLLKESLGDSTIPKSEALWAWKHRQNPFGTSYMLLAEEDGKLVGVRAFMKWNWVRNQKIYPAVRAVDTATHPAHQGKGIFKKLTLHQLDICRQQQVQFVFNTPNLQSLPGYLKMGWVEQGSMPVKIKLLRPLRMAAARFGKQIADTSVDPTPYQKWTNDVIQMADRAVPADDQLSTAMSSQYISWRYASNPLFNYNYLTDQKQFLLVTRIKSHNGYRELRITDFLLTNRNASRKELSKYIRNTLLQHCHHHKVDFVSLSGQQFKEHRALFHWMGWLPVRNRGPLITLRDLNMNDIFPSLLVRANWGYSLGDMELF